MAGSRTSRRVRYFPESGDYLTFVEEFLLQNEPCLFPETVTRGWRARQEWQKDGRPHIEYLARQFGDATVPVADCAKEHFNSHRKSEMKMADYLNYWRRHMQRDDGEDTAAEREKDLLYLKDWHFVKQYPGYGAYSVPPYFTSDWLNEAWDCRQDVSDDYRFVYFGPTGTWTPFHADVFRSYSWSANVCGRKEWLLVPPGEEYRLRDGRSQLPFDLRTSQSSDTAIRVIQEAGEVIFVPSSWWHQVHNLEDTISINHNWTNGFGLLKMWRHFQGELQEVKKEISDCREMENWEQHCQVVLRACVGMDYRELLEMLCLLARPRLAELENILSSSSSSLTTAPSLSLMRETTATSQVPTVFKREARDTPVDDLQSLLHSCSISSSRCQAMEQCLSHEMQRLLPSDRDLPTRTLCALRLFELQQISAVLSELLADLSIIFPSHS